MAKKKAKKKKKMPEQIQRPKDFWTASRRQR